MLVSLLPLFAALVAASPANVEMLLKQSLPMVPHGWEIHSAAPANQKINMHIGLTEQNMGVLQKRLLEMSDPSHADYGKHMSKTEIDELVAPSKSTMDSVTSWLTSHGIKAGEISNGMLPITITVAQAEKMLGTKYHIYHHAEHDKYTIRTTEYSVPKNVHSEITMIQPTTMFSDMGMLNRNVGASQVKAEKLSLSSRAAQACGSGVTVSCLRSLYSVNYTPNNSNSLLGIAGYLGEVASQDDLSQFLQEYNINPAGQLSVELVNGGTNQGSGTTEADLDIE